MKLATGRRLRNFLFAQLGWQIINDYKDRAEVGKREVDAAKVAVFDRLVSMDEPADR